jgi:RNA 2',3'-cyclic 3'-phosphodiesterase
VNKTGGRRLFFGLELPAAVKSSLLSLQQPLEGARWQQPEQLHLTLMFLGTLQEPLLASVQSAAQALPVKPFNLNLLGLGCFGEPESPAILWAGVEPTEPLFMLQSVLSQRLVRCGFQEEAHRFQPHITLAHFGQSPGSVRRLLTTYSDHGFGTLPVDFFSLFQSKPTPEGSVYTVLDRFALNP